jgi:hypothetical protein
MHSAEREGNTEKTENTVNAGNTVNAEKTENTENATEDRYFYFYKLVNYRPGENPGFLLPGNKV